MKTDAAVWIETERLVLRRFTLSDAEFVLRLVNEPSWLEFIGDKGVRTLQDACDYIRTGPLDMYERLGFGMHVVVTKDEGVPAGMCGLIKRDTLEDVDIGFAFLPQYRRRGYACEAASAVLAHAHRALGLERIVAITSPRNRSSIRLLEKLGLTFERVLGVPEGEPIHLFSRHFPG